MDNKIQYQQLLNQINQIKSKCNVLNSTCDELLNAVEQGVMVDDQAYKKEDIMAIKNNNRAIIEEIDTSILPIITQNLM